VKLTDLPFKLLRLITTSLNRSTLKSFSLVNKRCRAASEYSIFNTVKVIFSEYNLNILEELVKSSLAAYIKTLYYNASELFDLYILYKYTL
jgi:hypothetical protein